MTTVTVRDILAELHDGNVSLLSLEDDAVTPNSVWVEWSHQHDLTLETADTISFRGATWGDYGGRPEDRAMHAALLRDYADDLIELRGQWYNSVGVPLDLELDPEEDWALYGAITEMIEKGFIEEYYFDEVDEVSALIFNEAWDGWLERDMRHTIEEILGDEPEAEEMIPVTPEGLRAIVETTMYLDDNNQEHTWVAETATDGYITDWEDLADKVADALIEQYRETYAPQSETFKF